MAVDLANTWLDEDHLMLVAAWTRDGLTHSEIAEQIGISRKTFYQWKNNYPEFAEALRTSKEIVDYKVENALLKCALGYKAEEVKVVMRLRQGRLTTVEQEHLTKEIQPNVTAILAWLNNRKPDRWRRNRDNEESEKEDTNITVNIIRHGEKSPEQQSEEPTKQSNTGECNSDMEDWDEDDNDDWDTDADAEYDVPEPDMSSMSSDEQDSDWEEEWERAHEVQEYEEQHPQRKPKQVKATDKHWKEPGRYSDKGIIKDKKHNLGNNLNQKAEQSSSIEEDWDVEEEW